MMFLPDFLVCGAQKSGTTSLYKYLAQHPQCCMSSRKEPHFFSKAANLERPDRYEALFAHRGPHQLTGECSTSYLNCPGVPERIRSTYNDASVKLIFIIRNPVTRTISAYWNFYKRYEDTRSIKDALLLNEQDPEAAVRTEEERIQRALDRGQIDVGYHRRLFDDHVWNFRYIRNSMYRRDLQRYYDLFPKENILVLFSEQFIAEPEQEYKRITAFLDIDQSFVPSNLHRQFNKTFVPREFMFNPLVQKLRRLSIARRLLTASPGLKSLQQQLTRRGQPPVDQEVAAYLGAVLSTENAKLKSLVGADVGVWDV